MIIFFLWCINQSINHEFLKWPKYLKHCKVHYRQCIDTKCQISRMSGYDSVNRNVLSRVRKVARDGADITSGDRQFHTWGPATENARLPTVERWAGGCTRQSLQEQRSTRRLGRSATLVNGPRYDSAQPWSTFVHHDGNFVPDALYLMRPGTPASEMTYIVSGGALNSTHSRSGTRSQWRLMSASETWSSDASWKLAVRLRWGLTADDT